MAFAKDQLLLSAAKVTQLTNVLATPTVADPVQFLCDEADADVARMTTGFVLDPVSIRNFTRSLALYRVYAKAGPVPPDVVKDHDDALKELQAIAAGQRPNLPKVAATAAAPMVGTWGSGTKITGRIDGEI